MKESNAQYKDNDKQNDNRTNQILLILNIKNIKIGSVIVS
jgi:hypothetical protein